MPSIPILSGIYVDTEPQYRTSYPVNFHAVPKDTGISPGFLRPAPGLVAFGTGPGTDRGGINWNDTLYRVMGSKLVSVASDGTVTTIGDVGNDSTPVTFDYSFDRLCVASAGNLYYYDGATLTQVTDPDLGTVLDVAWVDGYFMTTDGEFLVVTELLDPTAVDPIKYGSSEADPDPVKALLKIRNEIYALNRNTIEVFDNIGTDLFPFSRVEGAQIQKGTLGTHTCCVYLEACAFLGSGRNEQPSIYLGFNAKTTKIATHEIDQILEGYTEAQLAATVLEARNEGSHEYLYVHLPDRTLVYDGGASQDIQSPVWVVLTSGTDGFSQYRAKHFVRCYDKWIFGDPTTQALGYLDASVSSHFGAVARWEFATRIVYNESVGVIFRDLELVGLPGYTAFGEDPRISTSYSLDGITWSSERVIDAGQLGQRQKRLKWFQLGFMRQIRMHRFKGTSDAHISFARLEAGLDPMAY